MKTSRIASVGGPVSHFVQISSIHTWLVGLLLVALCSLRAQAQYYDITDVKQLGFAVSVPDVILMEGQTVDAEISIGSVGAPVRGALGFEIWVEVGENGVVVPTLSPDMAGSWLASALVPTEARTLGTVTRYTYTYVRGVPADGSGLVLTLQLKASKDNVSASSIVSKAGGLMQIDNLELRTAATTAAPAPAVEVWPNPAAASARTVQVRCAGQPAQAIALYNLCGLHLANFDPNQPLDLTAYPAATYLLQVTDAAGHLQPQRLVLK